MVVLWLSPRSALWGLACVRQGSEESRRGWWAERGAPAPAAGLFVRPHGRRARSSRATLMSVQRPGAPRIAVVAATSCGSCWGAACRRIHSREEHSFAGSAWRQSDPNAHSGCGRARGRPTNTLGCARPHQTVGVAAPRPAPTEGVRLFGRTQIQASGARRGLAREAGLLQPSSARLASRGARDKGVASVRHGCRRCVCAGWRRPRGSPDDPAALLSIYRGANPRSRSTASLATARKPIQYGRRWVCSLSRGVEQMNVIIERTCMAQASPGSDGSSARRRGRSPCLAAVSRPPDAVVDNSGRVRGSLGTRLVPIRPHRCEDTLAASGRDQDIPLRSNTGHRLHRVFQHGGLLVGVSDRNASRARPSIPEIDRRHPRNAVSLPPRPHGSHGPRNSRDVWTIDYSGNFTTQAGPSAGVCNPLGGASVVAGLHGKIGSHVTIHVLHPGAPTFSPLGVCRVSVNRATSSQRSIRPVRRGPTEAPAARPTCIFDPTRRGSRSSVRRINL